MEPGAADMMENSLQTPPFDMVPCSDDDLSHDYHGR